MFGSNSHQLRSVIQWQNPNPAVIFEKWSENNDEIKNASKLIVGPGQGCIFVYEGQVQGVFANEGMTELKTANIPFWTTVTKFLQGFVSEHKVGLYFFKRSQLVDMKWGTPSVIKYEDPKYQFPVGLRAFGNFSLVVQKPEWFFKEIIGQIDLYTSVELRELITSRILQPMTDIFANSRFSYAEIDSHRNDLAKGLQQSLNSEFDRLGFSLTDFRIEGTSFDEDTMKRINRIADMSAEAQAANAAGLNYAQLQQLDAMKEAAKNPGGGAGMGMGLGVGVGLGQQLAGSLGTMNEDPALRLKKLKNLFDQGLITQEELEAKKKEILSKM